MNRSCELLIVKQPYYFQFHNTIFEMMENIKKYDAYVFPKRKKDFSMLSI